MFEFSYNTTLVAIGSGLLGAAAGTIGTFTVLRKRSLASDAVGHAALPGVAIAFMVGLLLGIEGRSLFVLLVGGIIAAGIGLYLIEAITRHTRLNADAAIGAVLSVSFGLGVVLLTVIQTLPTGGQAGLEDFILGSAASMIRQDVYLIGGVSALVIGLVVLFHRAMVITAFDRSYALTSGVNPDRIDLLIMALSLVVVVAGLKAAGAILVVALMIIPPTSARFWTNNAVTQTVLSALIGASCASSGALVSAIGDALPTGPVMVLLCAAVFLFSMIFAPANGLLANERRRAQLRHRLRQAARND